MKKAIETNVEHVPETGTPEGNDLANPGKIEEINDEQDQMLTTTTTTTTTTSPGTSKDGTPMF